jgi:hypothetical protein
VASEGIRMDSQYLNENEAQAWRQVVNDPAGLQQLVAYCHYCRTRKKLNLRPGCAQRMRSAYGRASKELPLAWNDHDEGAMFEAVARLTIAVGNAFDDGSETAFLVARLLLGGTGYELDPGIDIKYIRKNFVEHVQSARHTAIVELFDLCRGSPDAVT